MIEGYRIEGHAIVSADDRIADARGATPPELRNDADWARFQDALDRAAVTILGRRGHQAHPNPKLRNRLVLSSSAHDLERRPDAWWWNPADVSLPDALLLAAPEGGVAAVPGGQSVFDYFLAVGFDAFHLARKVGVLIRDGLPLFSSIRPGSTAEEILARHGLAAGPTEILDRKDEVTLTVWRLPRLDPIAPTKDSEAP